MENLNVGLIINGREITESNGESINVINPATGEIIAMELCCDEKCLNDLVKNSKVAFYSPEWQNLSAEARGKLLLKLADLIEKNAEKLIKLELLDTGKPISQLRNGEIPLTASIIRFYAGAADKIEGKVKSTDGGAFHLTTYEPYGVVLGILPWNYPLVNAAMKVAPALAAGNAIIVKPSVDTPLSTVEFGKLCIEAGIPAGIVNIALGSGSKTGQALVEHPEVKKISFTGSTSVGQSIQKTAADQMKAVNLELGGKNSIIVFADADLERAADATIMSAFVNAGQLCVSCSRVLVEESIADTFSDLLKEKLDRVKVGNPQDEDTLVGPMITKSQYDTALEFMMDSPKEGCQVLAGGAPLKLNGDLKDGYWLQPTILKNVTPDMKVAQEEIFGPVLSIIKFKDESEAVKISNSVMYGLSGSVWTSNSSRSLRMIKALKTGIIWINTMLIGYPQIPVPPHKMSGTGVELGMEGLMKYCVQKSAVIAYDDEAPAGWGL